MLIKLRTYGDLCTRDIIFSRVSSPLSKAPTEIFGFMYLTLINKWIQQKLEKNRWWQISIIYIYQPIYNSNHIKYKGKTCKTTMAGTGPRGRKIHQSSKMLFQSAPSKKVLLGLNINNLNKPAAVWTQII